MKSVIDKRGKKDYPGHDKTGLEGEIMSAEEDELLTVQDICDLLKVRETYIYSLTHKKKIPHIKMQGQLRFWRSEIDEWLRRQEVSDVGLQEKKQVVRLHNVPGRNKVQEVRGNKEAGRRD
ncbi:helix-turn-helix domain-containing protein [Candidatus Poribacteria bacterium]